MKKIWLTISLLILTILPVNASENAFDRNELENYGVNKKWEITDKNRSNVMNTPAVDAKEKIYDYADVLTEEEETTLKEKIEEFIEQSQMDMAIVIPKFAYTNDEENETYAADFYDYNDFGLDYEEYSGVLFLRNAYDEDPYFNIYTFGEAQLYFSYDRLEDTLDYIYEDIRSGNYLEGFSTFINEMSNYYSKGIPKEMENYQLGENGKVIKTYSIPWAICLITSGIITLITMIILVGKNKMVHRAKTATEYLKKDSVHINNKKDVFITSHLESHKISSDSGGSSGGGGSSMGSSGGFHSSGGGRHG